jgi:hypothetical protein
MKKIIIIIIVLTYFVIQSTNAQSTNAQWKLGVQGGLNFSDWSAEIDMEGRTLFGIGGIVEYMLNSNISFIAEPGYLLKGVVKPQIGSQPEMTVTISYLELPLLFKYSIISSGSIKPFFIAGPSIGYNMNSEMKTNLYGINFTSDLKDIITPFDFNLRAGTGVEIQIESFSFLIEGQYAFSLIDQHKNGTFQAKGGGLILNGTVTTEDWFKHRGIQLLVGIGYSL